MQIIGYIRTSLYSYQETVAVGQAEVDEDGNTTNHQHKEDRQSLVTEIETLKVVLYLVSRRKDSTYPNMNEKWKQKALCLRSDTLRKKFDQMFWLAIQPISLEEGQQK